VSGADVRQSGYRAWHTPRGKTNRYTDETLGRSVAGPEIAPEGGIAYVVSFLKWRAAHNYDSSVLLTGDEGNGKSTLGFRIVHGVGRWDWANLDYTVDDVLASYERLNPRNRGMPIFFDEGAREYYSGESVGTPKQKALSQAFMLVRELGGTLVACWPTIWAAPKQFRSRRATLWIHVKSRGIAWVFERDHRLTFLPSPALRFTRSPTCPMLTWEPYPEDSALWVRYSAIKTKRLHEFLAEIRAGLREGKDEE